jgi:predicted ATPase/DNA-binding CsgD family transcriptional regulator
MGLGGVAPGAALPALRAHLQHRRLLLVLDNVEQLLPAATTIGQLAVAGPGVRVLVTSRAPLRLSGEREVPVEPLPVPDLERVPTPEEAATPAVELFVARAQAVVPSFQVTQANAAAVVAICRRLDGLPLAIELAATRLRVLSPTELLARLDAALPVLAGGARDLPERQRTIRGAIDWSYRLLGPAEQDLLRRLSVFVGGWTLPAVEAIAGHAEGGEALDSLTVLAEHSLVGVATGAGGESRYRMLETIRQFGVEQLAGSGDADAARNAHLAWYAGLAATADPHLRGPGQARWLDRLEEEHGNIRAALAWALESPDPAAISTGLRLASSLWEFWFVRSHLPEGHAWLQRLLARAPATPSPERALALFATGMFAPPLGDFPGSVTALEESLAIAVDLGDGMLEGMARFGLGDTLRMMHSDAESSRQYQAADALFVREEDQAWIGITRNALAVLALKSGDAAGAARLAAESLEVLRAAGDSYSVTEATAILGNSALAQHDIASAARHYRDALDGYWAQRDRLATARTIESIAVAALAVGEGTRAVRLGSAAAATRAETLHGRMHSPFSTATGRQAMAEARQRLGDAAFDAAWVEGQPLRLETAVTEARALAASLMAYQPAPASPTPRTGSPGGLSEREAEVLRLVAQGRSNAEVADALYISRRTVDAHMRRIYDRLGLDTRVEAIRYAIEQGLA